MAASTREVYLLLRARDEASRVVRGFSGELSRAAARAAAAALRAEAITKRQEAARLRAAGATRAQVDALLAEGKALDDQANSMINNERRTRQFAQATMQVAGAMETLGIAMAAAGGLALRFLFNTAKDWAEYQRTVSLTRTQVDGFEASLQDLSDLGIKIGRQLPIAFEQIQPALFDIFSSTNANLQQAEILLRNFSAAAVAGQTDIQTAARGTITIMNAYNIPFEQVNKVLDIQFQLVRKGVGTYEDFAKVFGRVVPSATRAGQSFETVAAMLAFMTRNGQSAAMAASAAARAMDALTHPKTVTRLEKMGVKVKDIHGNFLPLIDILTGLRKKLMELPPADRVGALFELFKASGGTIQARRFLEQVLLRKGELEDFAALLRDMGDASGAMDSAFGQMADTAAAKMQLLSNRWTALKLAIGEAATPGLLVIVDMLSKVVEWFNNLSPSMKNIITQFLIWGSVLGIVGGIFIGFLGLIIALVAAFVLAGTEILIVIGALVAIGAIIVAVAATFTLLWKRSENFRNSIGNLGKSFKELWEQGIKPALATFVDFWQSKVQPVINDLIDYFGDRLAEAINFVADIIRNYLIPAIQEANKWYQENKAEVDRAINVLIQIGKVVLQFGAILVAIFVGLIGGAIIASILSFITAIQFLVMMWTGTVGGIVAAWEWLKGAWAAGVSFVMDLWHDILDAIQAGMDWLGNAWQSFWESRIGKLIIAIWELIVAVVQLGIASTTFAISWALKFIINIWTTTWNAVASFFKMIWNGLVSFWNFIWGLIGGKATSAGNAIKNFLSGVWNSISSTAVAIWNGVYNTIAKWLDAAWAKVKSIWNTIKDFFAGAKNWLFDAGAKIVQGLIDGITSKINKLKEKINQLTQLIKDHFPFSPAKTGPLSGRGNPFYSGQSIANLLASGMLSMTDQVAMASAALARQVNPSADVGTFNPLVGPGMQGRVGVEQMQEPASKVVNVDVTINTQEVDARSLSTDLGWYVGSRL